MDPITQVYDYLDRNNKEEAETYSFNESKSRFNPSRIGDCSRALWYRMTGSKPRPVAGFVSLYGQDGDISHDSVRWLMYKAGVKMDWLDFDEDTGIIKERGYFRKEFSRDGIRFVISGRADGLVYIPDVDRWIPLEIKSVDGSKARWIQEAYENPEKDILDYLRNGNKGKYFKWLKQMTLTSHCMGYDESYFIMKDRSMCQIGFFNSDENKRVREGLIIPNDPELLEEMMDKAFVVQKMVNEDITPVHDYLEGSYECKICPFNHICRDGKE